MLYHTEAASGLAKVSRQPATPSASGLTAPSPAPHNHHTESFLCRLYMMMVIRRSHLDRSRPNKVRNETRVGIQTRASPPPPADHHDASFDLVGPPETSGYGT